MMINKIKLINHLIALASLAALLTAGCASMPTADLRADYPEEKTQIEHCLQEVFAAAENKDFDRLDKYHFYGPKFTKFSGASPTRLDASACRMNEHEGLAAITNLKTRTEDLKIDVFGNVGIATFILNYSFDFADTTVHKKERSTLVFVKDREIWKIAHEHMSPTIPSVGQ